MKKIMKTMLFLTTCMTVLEVNSSYGSISKPFEDAFTKDIYDVSPSYKGYRRFTDEVEHAKKSKGCASLWSKEGGEGNAHLNQYATSLPNGRTNLENACEVFELAHQAAIKNSKEGDLDYIAVGALYFHKLQSVHQRSTHFLTENRDFLENARAKLVRCTLEKGGFSLVSQILESIGVWATCAVAKSPIPAIGMAALHLFGKQSEAFGNQELDLARYKNDMDKAIHAIDKEIHQQIDRVFNEPVKDIEEAYIKLKIRGEKFIPKDLQDYIEENLINSRNALYPFAFIKQSLEYAVKLPHIHKELSNPLWFDFINHKFIKRYSLQNQEQLGALAWNIIKFSGRNENDETLLRAICYFSGGPGTGKTEAVKFIAKFFKLPIYQRNVRDLSDLSSQNLEGSDAMQPGSIPGWMSDPLFETNEEGQRYTNAILLLDEFDRVLFNPSSSIEGLTFFLDFLDPKKFSFHNHYFKSKIGIRRLHVFVAGNTDIPATKEYAAVRERFPYKIHFDEMSKESKKEILEEYLPEVAKLYKVSQDEVTFQNTSLSEQAIARAENPNSVRSCKQALTNVISSISLENYRKLSQGSTNQSKEDHMVTPFKTELADQFPKMTQTGEVLVDAEIKTRVHKNIQKMRGPSFPRKLTKSHQSSSTTTGTENKASINITEDEIQKFVQSLNPTASNSSDRALEQPIMRDTKDSSSTKGEKNED